MKRRQSRVKSAVILVLVVLSTLSLSCSSDSGGVAGVFPVEWQIVTWLTEQQDETTGLVQSQEDSSASTYNNALAIIAFTLKGLPGRAEKILDFYDGRFNGSEFFVGRQPRGFFQYRDSRTGVPLAGSNRWMGDNSWLGLAIRFYQSRTGDAHYERIAVAITSLLKSWQQADGHIASGWENSDAGFNTAGSAEGNLDAYKVLALYGEAQRAAAVKDWLDYNNLNWEKGPLDIHTWRVLALGGGYGFSLQDIDRADLAYKQTVQYRGRQVTGFVPFSAADAAMLLTNNIWSEGTGQAAVAFYKAGYADIGDLYAAELEKLAFASPNYQGTKTISFLAFPDAARYPWVNTDKGHVAGVCWYLFARNRFDPFDGVVMASVQKQNPASRIQGENYTGQSGPVRKDQRGVILEGDAVHLAGDDADPGVNRDGWTEYTLHLVSDLPNASLRIRYADDILHAPMGDLIRVWLDGSIITMFNTNQYTFGTWDDYVWSNAFSAGNLAAGDHVLRVEGLDLDTYGFTVDAVELNGN